MDDDDDYLVNFGNYNQLLVIYMHIGYDMCMFNNSQSPLIESKMNKLQQRLADPVSRLESVISDEYAMKFGVTTHTYIHRSRYFFCGDPENDRRSHERHVQCAYYVCADATGRQPTDDIDDMCTSEYNISIFRMCECTIELLRLRLYWKSIFCNACICYNVQYSST